MDNPFEVEKIMIIHGKILQQRSMNNVIIVMPRIALLGRGTMTMKI